MALIYTQYVWECLYSSNEGGKIIEGYTSDSLHAISAGDRMFRHFSSLADTEDSALFVGCAFGNTMQLMYESGMEKIAGVDNSPYVHSELSTQGLPDVKDRIVNAGVGIDGYDEISKDLYARTGLGSFDWVVTENVISAMSNDDEIRDFLIDCEGLLSKSSEKSNIIHYVTTLGTTKGDSGLNWKTIEEWGAYAPSHTWLSTSDISWQ